MQKILLATDGSIGADRAAAVAADLSKALGASLTVLTVGGNPNLSREDTQRLYRAEGAIGEILDDLSKQVLAQAVERIRQRGVAEAGTQAGWGDPAEVVIDTAREMQTDYVVMGRRGRGRLAGLLLGSVSQKVATLAPCVVVLVP